MHKAIRYIGSKQKALSFLDNELFSKLREQDLFYDGFSGTGIVSQYVAEKYNNVKISGGDLSNYSNILFNILNLGSYFPNINDIKTLINEFLNQPLIEGIIFNEFSLNGQSNSYPMGRNFFHPESAKTIDTFRLFIKQKIENEIITINQAKILFYFLLTYTCKVANTTSVFGAFLKGEAQFVKFNLALVDKILNDLTIIYQRKNISTFYLGDIVNTLNTIPKQNIIYLDPPYNHKRRYENNYHILNFIVDLNFNGNILMKGSKTGQTIHTSNNPFWKREMTEKIFSDMIKIAVNKSNLLGISYNSDGIITQDWMENFCYNNNYKLNSFAVEYKRFQSQKDINNSTKLNEILWLIKI